MTSIASSPILSCADAKAWEARLLKDEAAEWAAMERAGIAIGGAVLEDFREIGGFPEDGRILALAGKGHNGGDALIAAREILQRHPAARASVLLVFGEQRLRPLARRALERLRSDGGGRVEVVPTEHALGAGTRYALCLDGVFGFQFRTPLDAQVAALIERVNAHAGISFRAAIDLPSGAGEVCAETIFRADFTYATGIVKRPVLAPVLARFVGRLRFLDLGFFADEAPPVPERVVIRAVLAPLALLRAAQTDKRTFGHVFVVGGSRSYPGAVVMAARAALRSGAGLVTAFVPASLAADYAARHPEVMWVASPESSTGALVPAAADLIRSRIDRATALLVGPGLSAEAGAIALAQDIVRLTNLPLVFDADALRKEVIAQTKGRAFVVTPHQGELKRIASELFAEGRFAAPQGVLVAKGPLTHVTDGRTTFYSPFGGPVLARGGSGDILAGLIGGLLAQTPDDPLLAACRGVAWHGWAADLLARARGQVAVEISEILEHLGPALLSPPCPTTP